MTHFYKIKCDHIPQSEYLDQLVNLCDYSIIKNTSFEKEVCNDFNIAQQNDYPIAAILANEKFSKDSNYTFFQATPCYFSLQRDFYKFERNLENECSSDELQRLCEELNQHFSDDECNFFMFEKKLYFATLKKFNISTYFPEEINQVPNRDFLPFGPDKSWWHKFINELQMFLFNHEINRNREKRNDYPINSIWFCGGGSQIQINETSDVKDVYSNLTLLKKIAILDPKINLIDPYSYNKNPKKNYFFYDQVFQSNNQDIFKFIFETFETKKIKNLNLSLHFGLYKILFKTSLFMRLKFWKKKKNLQEILNEA